MKARTAFGGDGAELQAALVFRPYDDDGFATFAQLEQGREIAGHHRGRAGTEAGEEFNVLGRTHVDA
ncbi:hypothetical protein D3C78_1577040 [compost metagenome]